MYDCFISYKVGADDQLAHDFATFLKDDDFTVFIDKKALLPGQNWADELKSAVTQSNYVLAFFTADYLARIQQGNQDQQNFIIEELTWAINQNKLIPISIGIPISEIENQCAPLVDGLKGIQYIAFEHAQAVDHQIILNQINKLIRRQKKATANKVGSLAATNSSELTSAQAYIKLASTWNATEAIKFKEKLENKFLKEPIDFVVLAKFHLVGRFGIKIEPELAHEYLLMASKSDTDCHEAFYELGLLYEYPTCNLGGDEDKAVRFYTVAHEGGDIRATYRLAILFDDNIENANSPTSFLKKKYAIEHYNQFSSVIFSKQSLYRELNNLEKYAYCNMQWHAKPNDDSDIKAIENMQALASLGSLQAAYWLGWYYSEPEQSSSHIHQALRFLHAAEAQGCVFSRSHIASLNLEAQYSHLDFEQNIEFGIKKHQENIQLNFHNSTYFLVQACNEQPDLKQYITQDSQIALLEEAVRFGDKDCADILFEICQVIISTNVKVELTNETEALLEKCLRISKSLYEAAPEKSAEDYASFLDNVVEAFEGTGRTSEALAVEEECMPIYKSLYNQDNERWAVSYANSLHNLGVSLGKAGRAPEAMAVEEECMPIYKSLYNQDNVRWAVSYANSLTNLSISYENIGRREESRALEDKSYRIMLWLNNQGTRPE